MHELVPLRKRRPLTTSGTLPARDAKPCALSAADWAAAASRHLQWDFNSEHMQRLNRVKSGVCVKSSVFVLHDLRWQLRCYPQGLAREPNVFAVFLDLVSIPLHFHSVKASLSLCIPQTSLRSYKSYAFMRRRERGHAFSGVRLSWRDTAKAPLLALDALTLIVAIDIRQINWAKVDAVCGQLKLLDPVKISNHVSYEWKVTKQQFERLRGAQLGQKFASPKFSCWFLRFTPNGDGRPMAERDTKGCSVLSLCLLELPGHLGAITARIKLSCMEYSWTGIAAFKHWYNGSDPVSTPWPADTMSLVQFSRMDLLDQVTFACEIDILAVYDRNGNEADSEQYRRSLAIAKRTASDAEDDGKEQHETPGFLEDEEDVKVESAESSQLQLRIRELERRLDQLLKSKAQKPEPEQASNVMFNNNGNETLFQKWYRQNVGLPEYYDALVDNGFDSRIAITQLTDDDLAQMGVAKRGHRLKILKVIQQSDF